MKKLLALLGACLAALPALAQQPAQPPIFYPQLLPVLPGMGAPNPWLQYLPATATGSFFTMPFAGMPIPLLGTLQPKPTKPYTMRPPIPQETKRQMMQMMMPMMTSIFRMDMPDAMNWFAHKYKAKPGLSFDDVMESLNLRANQLNFKYVGSNLMWKDFQAVLGDKESPRIEVHSYCDIAVGRDLLKISPEFLVFLPCRIAVMEDSDRNIWVMMLDWNMDWVSGFEGNLSLTPELIKGARDIRDKMDNIMRAAANGEL